MKRLLCMFLLCSVLLGSGLVSAGDGPLSQLQALEGEWQQTFLQVDETGTYQPVGTSTSRIEVKLGGKLVQEQTVIKTATAEFPLLVNYTYDRVRGVYRKSSTDGVTGLMDIQEGSFENGVLTLSNVNRQTWFVGSSGKELAFHITFDLNNPERPLMTADLSADYGKTWQRFQQVIYQRTKAVAAARSGDE